jgi:hypothetical protein
MEPGEHGTAGEDNSRNIGAGSCHQHTGHNFVAGADADQTVEPVCLRHQFDGIGNIFAGWKGIPHPFVAHGNTIAYTDNAEFKGHSPGSGDAFTDFFSKLSQVNVSRNDGIEGICNANEWQFHLIVRDPQ